MRKTDYIGRASLARENEAGGSCGQEVHILHVNVNDFVLFLVVIIELFQSNYFSYTSEGLLQTEVVEHFAGDNDHGSHEF